MTDDYGRFLAGKRREHRANGIGVPSDALSPHLSPWQRDIVRWALHKGRAALFCDCGLGKTFMQLEWARVIHQHTGQDVLILAPLAVGSQTRNEAVKFDIAAPVTLCRDMADVRPGINVTNYERLERFDVAQFGGVVLDESSILKAYAGTVKRQLVRLFQEIPYKLCATATPSPNDHTEIGNHAEFLGIMPSNEMIARWFITDGFSSGKYRLKGHAAGDFWEWVSSWAIAMQKPSDLGYPDDGYTLPELTIRDHILRVDLTIDAGDRLFRTPTISATAMHKELRRTAPERAAAVAELVNDSPDAWVVWCHTNYEADELVARIPDAIEVRGSESPDDKERKLQAFTNGDARVIVTKPSIAGFGLNWQHCHRTAFVGLSYSFEQFYQAIRRLYRFGQTQPVEAVIVAAETELEIVETVKAKMADHASLMAGMHAAASRLSLAEDLELIPTSGIHTERGADWTLHHGDCIEVTRQMETASVDFSIFSPPFSNLYIYSDALEDMGNAADDDEFMAHFGFLVPELHRVTRPGRLCAVHCKQLVNYKGRDGMAGLRDFRGDIIRAFVAHGWAYHSEVTIWTDPVLEMQKTKANGLLYKTLRADSTYSRQGLPEYLLLFRRWPDDDRDPAIVPVTHTHDEFPLPIWQRYASPVWFDVSRTRVLNVQQAREDRDEKHLCPLQLDVIDRALDLWTNPGDLVYSPFAGIASEGYESLLRGRRFVGAELKRSYFDIACRNLRQAETQAKQPSLFDVLELEGSAA